MERFETAATKNHEIQMQELRHERKTESQRLDNLKKGLQAMLETTRGKREPQAA